MEAIVWQERNIRIFQNEFTTNESVFRIIVDTVRHKLLGLKIKRSFEVEKAAAIWKIPLKCLNGGDGRRQNKCDNGVT